jgi:hypothetical protein
MMASRNNRCTFSAGNDILADQLVEKDQRGIRLSPKPPA